MKNLKNQTDPVNPGKPGRLSLRENNILTKTISRVFLVLIIAGLFAFIIYGLFKFNLIQTPAFIENIFSNNSGSIQETKNDDAYIYDFLRDNNTQPSDGATADAVADNSDSAGYVLNITLDNIKDIISQIKLPDNMYLKTTAKYYNGGQVSKQVDMSLWKKGGKYKYTLTVNSKPEELYINDTKKEYIENYITESKTTKDAGNLFNFDSIPNMPNISYYLNLLDSGMLTDCKIERGSDENTVTITYEIQELNQTETIKLSLDTGIVISVQSYTKTQDGNIGSLYYECETSVQEAYYNGDRQAEDKTAIVDSLFAVK